MNNVELINYFGDDLMVVNAARVSFGKEKKIFDKKDLKLLNYLVNNETLIRHSAPFRHPQLQYRVKCPIYVERQLFKHQVGLTANSISGRYVDFSDSYAYIDRWRVQSKSSKQGSGEDLPELIQEECNAIQDNVVDCCSAAYEKLIELGVSKEQARTILPLNLNTQFIWTGSLLAFLHLFNLRLKKDAQQETREIVQQMLDQLKNLEGQPFKYSLEVWGY